MTDRTTLDEKALLLWCAILQEVGAETLQALAGVEAAAARRVLGSQAFDLVAESGLYRLRDERRQAVLAQLRREQPREEVRLHEQVLYHLFERLEPASQSFNPTLEEACIIHLTALHDLSIEYMDWRSIILHVQAARNAGLHGARTQDWLEFFEAYTAVRTGDLEAGWARLEGLRARPDLEERLRVRVLHACSIPYADQGRYEEALQLCQEACRLAEDQSDLFRQGYLLLSIGIIYNDLEDHQRALEYCERSLGLFRRIGAVYREAHVLYEIGNNAMRLGDWRRARAALDEAAELYTRLGIARRLVMTSWAQGVIYLMLGDVEQSEAALNRALEIALTPGGEYPSAAMDTLAQLGLLYQAHANYEKSRACFERAITIADHHQLRHPHTIYLYRLAEVLRSMGRTADAAAAYRKAVQGIEALRSSTELEELKLSLLGTTQYIYESLVLFCLEHETPVAAFDYVEQARARAFLDILARQRPDLYAAFEHPTVTLVELQSQLGAGEVLLEYFTTGVLPLGDHALHHIPAHNRRLREVLVPKPQILLFAITRDIFEVHRIAVDPNRLRPSIHADDPILSMLQAEGRARWLYDQLIQPIQHLLASCQQLYIVPHGSLHYMPFSALRAPDDDYLLRANGPTIVMAPSATVLVRNCLSQPAGRGRRGLAIGYNDPDGQPLVYAETEAQFVARLLGGQAWVGSESKSDRLLEIAPDLRWLHIAGHALYDHKASLTSSLRLGSADDLDAGAIMNNLHLSADLVTLSSCMSGFSRIVPGDELLGLQRAFLYAGAPTVVCTLARTRDVVAFLVMSQFYQHWLEGATAAAALRDALVTVRSMPRALVAQELLQLGYRSAIGEAELTMSNDDVNNCPFAKPEFWGPFMLIGRP